MTSRTSISENLPSNEQLQKAMDTTKTHIQAAKADEEITPTGKKIIDDTTRVIDSAKQFLLEKNEGEKVQRLIKETELATHDLSEHADRLRDIQEETLSRIDSDRLRDLARETLRTARLAGMEILSSSSFRRSILSFVQLASDVFTSESVGLPTVDTRGKIKTETGETPSLIKGKEKPLAASTSGVSGPSTGERRRVRFLRDSEEPVTRTSPVVPPNAQQVPSKSEVPAEGRIVKLSDEQVSELYHRFIVIVREITNRERSRRVYQGLLDMFDLLSRQFEVVGEEGKERTKEALQEGAWDVTHNKHVLKALRLAREIFEEFTGNKTLDPLLRSVRHIINIFREDPETRNYFYELRDYFRDILRDPDLLNQDAQVKRGEQLIRRGRELGYKKQLNKHVNLALSEVRDLVNNAANDPTTNRLRADMKKLIHDVALDKDGNLELKPEVLDQLRVIIVSSLIERMQIPLPKIYLDNKDYEMTIKDMVLNVEQLVPENIKFKSKAKIKMDLKKIREPELAQVGNIMTFAAKGINVHVPSCSVWFRRKSFPKVQDEGRATITVGGKGIDLKITLKTLLKSPDFFEVDDVDCDVHHLKIHLSETKHDFLYNAFIKVFSPMVKRNMEASIQRRLESNLNQLNLLMKKQMKKSRLISSMPSVIQQKTEIAAQ